MRKILYAIGVTCTLLLSLYGLNFFSNEIVNQKMLDNVFDRNDFAWLGFMEPWKEPYNLGTNYLRQRKYPEAIEQFDKALTHAIPDDSECEVRINKALAMTLPIQEDQVNDRNLDSVITKLEEAEQVLLEKNFAAEDGNGDYEDAQILYDDIVEYKLHLIEITNTKFLVDKIDKDDKSSLDGAKILITGVDAEGNNIKFDPDNIVLGQGAYIDEEYHGNGIMIVSGTSPTLIDKIFDGTYTIHEEQAPKGYDVAADVVFTVRHCKVLADGNEAIIEATDTDDAFINLEDELFRTDVDIKKVNQNGEILPGAILTVTGVNFKGETVEFTEESYVLGEDGYINEASSGEGLSFVTGSTDTTLLGLLDGTYTIHEDKAPKGYTEVQDIVITIEQGVVTCEEQPDIITPPTSDSNTIVTVVDPEDQEQQSGGGGDGQGEGEDGGGQGEGDGEGGGGQGGEGEGGQGGQSGGEGEGQDGSGSQGGDDKNDGSEGGEGGENGNPDDKDDGGQGGQSKDDGEGDDNNGTNEGQGDDDNKGGGANNDGKGGSGEGEADDDQSGEDELKNNLSDLQDEANQQRSGDLAGDNIEYASDYEGDIW
ncbi:MAG: hypothetical protein K6G47_09045 [Clostridia bacterium]|nr:hypothetical protein [Clostridia bacterium]